MDIYDLLDGKSLTRENLRSLQRDPRASGLSPKYDADYSGTVEDALRDLDKKNHPHNVSILKEDSPALHMAADDVLDFDFIVRAKMDKRYSGDPCQRDPLYVKAVAAAVQELANAQDKAQAGESSNDSDSDYSDSDDSRSWQDYMEE